MKKIVIFVFLIFSSCATFKNISGDFFIEKKDIVAVLPFINNSETPMSGFKAKNIVENELYSKKINILPFENNIDQENFSEKDIKQIFTQLKEKGVSYALYGYVNEWRYKTGIDSEPAVSLTINLYDLKNDKIVWTGSGSKSLSSYSSVGITAQKLVKSILSSLKSK